MAIENTFFARYVVSWENMVEHAWNFGVLLKVRDGGQNADWSKITGTFPNTDIWLQLNFYERDG